MKSPSDRTLRAAWIAGQVYVRRVAVERGCDESNWITPQKKWKLDRDFLLPAMKEVARVLMDGPKPKRKQKGRSA